MSLILLSYLESVRTVRTGRGCRVLFWGVFLCRKKFLFQAQITLLKKEKKEWLAKAFISPTSLCCKSCSNNTNIACHIVKASAFVRDLLLFVLFSFASAPVSSALLDGCPEKGTSLPMGSTLTSGAAKEKFVLRKEVTTFSLPFSEECVQNTFQRFPSALLSL